MLLYCFIALLWALASLFVGLCGYPGFLIAGFVNAAKHRRSFTRSGVFLVSCVFGLFWWSAIQDWVIPHSSFLSAHYESTWVAIFFLSVIVFIDSVTGFSTDLFWKWFGPTSAFMIDRGGAITDISLDQWRKKRTGYDVRDGLFSTVAFSNKWYRLPVEIRGKLSEKWTLKRFIGPSGALFFLTCKTKVGAPDFQKIFSQESVFSMMDATKEEEKRHLELQKGIQAIFELAEEDKDKYRSPACQILRENLGVLRFNHNIIPNPTWKEFFRYRTNDFWKKQEARRPKK